MKKILTLIFALIAVVSTVYAQDAEPDYLFFKCIDEKGCMISVQKTGYATFDIQYSRDKKTWTDFSNYVRIGKDGIVYFKGKNPNGMNSLQFKVSGACECGGNIMTLIDGKGETTVIPRERCFCALFKDCDKLTTAPKLPATTLRDLCYQDMFSGCKNLITAPELPATTLASWCYELMFSGCTSLTTAPELPATALKPECYDKMFSGCTSLTTAPELPATILAGGCYNEMFKDCTSLTTAPDLPATKLTKECYQEMFDGCTSLIAAPELPATTLAESCYRRMFSRCTSLTGTPDLPVTDLEKRCYAGMFSGCTSLTTAPKLPATTLAVYCYNGMFYGCTSLTAAPELPATKLAQYCYSGMFSGCTKLTTAPTLPATNLYMCHGCYSGMFSNCTGLTSAPELPATELVHNCYDSMFSGCTSLTVAPELPVTDLMPECYSSMFKNCTSLIAAPELPATEFLSGGCYQFMFSGCTALTAAPKLPAKKMNGDCYKGMFYNCTGLTTAPELPATELWKSCYEQMFSGCTGLSVAPKLPAAELKSMCYYGMFSGCTGLTEAPELPATTLAGYCYQNMFEGCTNLKFVPGLPATTLAAGCYKSMFSGCLNLTSAPPLPATTLASSCYYCMFQDCSNLSSAPNVTATVLADSCCMRMFTMCTNLTQAPQLTATKLKYKCYYEMFAGCASLNVAPALPATTLDTYCYDGMFQDCVNLTTAPELPATTLSEYCYMNMFKGCTCLTNVPDLPATQVVRGCYNGMFYGCKKLDRLSVQFLDWLTGAQPLPTGEWLYNVAKNGYFICNSVLKNNSKQKEGSDFIPSGWIILSSESAQTVFSISQYDKNITTDKTSAMYDEVVNFTVKDRSNEGYLLDKVLVNNVEIPVINFKGSFKMVDFLKNILILAWYSKINYLINCDGFSQSDKSTANIDDVIEVTFMQRTGYELVSATINGQPLKVNNYHSSFKMPAENVNLRAQYNKRTYTIVCDDYSSVEASGANMDDKIGVTFSKRDGYTLTSATFNGTALSINDYRSSFTMPAADVEIKSVYTPTPYAVSCTDANITADKTTATIEDKVNLTIKDRTDEGYKLDKVSVNSTEIKVQGFKASFDMKDYLKDVTITAQYSKVPYTITTDEYAQVANTTANMGDVVNVTFKQREGYTLTSATYNGSALSISDYKSTFTMPAANVEIKTVYAPIAYAVSCTDANITADKTTATIEDKVNLTIKDRTSDGYKLDKVSVNSTEIAVKDFKASFDMKDYMKDVTISAQYSKIPYAISTDEYSQVANTTATVDDAITVTFKQREGFDLTSATCNGNPLNIKDYKATFTMPAQDVEIKTVYTEKVYEIEKPSEGVSVSQPSAKAGDEITISVNPKDGYTVHLYVNGAEVALSGNSAVYTMPSGKIEITVKYVVEEKTPVSEIELDNCAVSVFPNPAKSGEEITLNVGGKFDMNTAKIYLYNASGSLVMQIDNVKEYNQLTLRSGVYVGVLVTNGGKKTFRVAVK